MAATDAPVTAVARVHQRRRRFLFASIAGLSVLGASLGVSFLDNSGASAVTISAGTSSNFVYSVADGTKLPSAVTSLVYTSGTYTSGGTTASRIAADGTIGAAVVPGWTPVADTPGSVATAGDLALIDASQVSGKVVVSVYITNLADLSKAYTSFAFPINVYKGDCSTTPGTCTWTGDSTVVTQSATSFSSYLTDTAGVITFTLDGGSYYDIVMEGDNTDLDAANSGVQAPASSFYCIDASDTANLGPKFFFTAQPTAA